MEAEFSKGSTGITVRGSQAFSQGLHQQFGHIPLGRHAEKENQEETLSEEINLSIKSVLSRLIDLKHMNPVPTTVNLNSSSQKLGIKALGQQNCWRPLW